MLRKSFVYTGTNNATYASVPPDSNFSITGTGSVTINGSIGESCYINKSGTGQLNINGPILKYSKLKLSGVGNIFLHGAIEDHCRSFSQPDNGWYQKCYF